MTIENILYNNTETGIYELFMHVYEEKFESNLR